VFLIFQSHGSYYLDNWGSCVLRKDNNYLIWLSIKCVSDSASSLYDCLLNVSVTLQALYMIVYYMCQWLCKLSIWLSMKCFSDSASPLYDCLLNVSVTLQALYKLKTGKVFEDCSRPPRGGGGVGEEGVEDDCPYAVQHIYLCLNSRLLCVAGVGHVIIFRFNKSESNLECPVCISFNILFPVPPTYSPPPSSSYLTIPL